MSQSPSSEVDKMLDLYIYDYLMKRKLHASADSLLTEGKLLTDPVAIDVPGGFLFEWWSVFWDLFITRTNRNHSEAAASYIELQRQQRCLQMKIQQNQQMQMQQLVQQRYTQQPQEHQQQRYTQQPQEHHQHQRYTQQPQEHQQQRYTQQPQEHQQQRYTQQPQEHQQQKHSQQQQEHQQQRHTQQQRKHQQRGLQRLKQPRDCSRLVQDTANRLLVNNSLDRHNPITAAEMIEKMYEEKFKHPLQRDVSTDSISKRRLIENVSQFPDTNHASMFRTTAMCAQPSRCLSSRDTPESFGAQNQSLQPPRSQILKGERKSTLNPRISRTEGSLMGIAGSNQSTGNLSLKGWSLTGLDQLGSGLLQQPESLIQLPQALNQFQMQHQLMFQAPQNLGITSADELTYIRSGVPSNNQNMNIGKDNQLKLIDVSNVESLVPVCSPVLPRVDADVSIKNPVSSEHSLNSNHQNQQQDKLKSVGIINADGYTSNSFQSDEQADMDHIMDDGTTVDAESLSPDETDLEDEGGPTFKEIRLIPASNNKVECCRFSSDGKLLASGGHDKKATVWCTESFTVKSTFDEHSQWITDVCFSPRMLKVATSSGDKTVKVWNVDNPGRSVRTFSGHSTGITSLDFHPSKDDLICSCDTSSEIRYWSTKNGSCVGIFKGGATQLRFQPDNGRILAAAMGNFVSMIDVETQVCRVKLQGHKNYIRSVCWDPRGEYLASVSNDLAKVWKVGSGGKADCIYELNCNEHKFHTSVFHPTYPSLLIISSYESLVLWDMTENKTRTLHAHDETVTSLTASNVSGLVASTGHDKCVKLWQ